ncbi:MAG: putative GTPase [Alphaproteobacteria bacterium MarineAlpha6_Bin4]|nr:MAG: putative GTPase [Alphaproteobacteria bacterium MarineAlpha6_Bin3]PPR38501.1 MAG: putative GTPase [Alphaproteobacteria bacterium MarineAlpha6_Bin4]|tara:strand:- start:3491 stop:4381 length:891 start_codon:yes stop_codon:yes gene_type:complete
MDIKIIKKSGKTMLANALVEIEKDPFDKKSLSLLTQAFNSSSGEILGITGPPGVGKSSLIKNLIKYYRNKKKSVAVIAVDPSSKKTKGALLGDRIRLETDPGDKGLFIRSMAARDKLGGLASITLSSAFLLNAIFDITIIETVGVGQSETDIANIADTVLFCVQPGSGDVLQFMKAGIVEIPDIIAITKSDLGDVAINTKNDVINSIKIGNYSKEQEIPVILISSKEEKNIETLIFEIEKQQKNNLNLKNKKKDIRSVFWLEESIKEQFGVSGIKKLKKIKINKKSPFLQFLEITK